MIRLLCSALLLGCAKQADAPRVSVMTFNVENLFDTRHEPGKNDLAYLPLKDKKTPAHAAACAKMERPVYRDQCLYWDWSEALLEVKLQRVAATILQANGGRGPDILLLQEVENREILERLRRGPLAAAAYRPGILLEGDDARGIDQAILTRLPPAGEPFLYKDPGGALSRGVLVAALRLPDGTVLETAAVHFPSPAAPRHRREAGIAFLNEYRVKMRRDSLMLVGGDFNITAEEEAEFRVWEGAAAHWVLAHELGCRDCKGTNYYAPKKSWSFLDAIILSKNMSPTGGAPWRIDAASVRVLSAAPQQADEKGRPLRFDPLDSTGVSDHFPLLLDLVKAR